MIGVTAIVYQSGGTHIRLSKVDAVGSAAFLARVRHLCADRSCVQDWQAATYDAADIKSGLMADFGIEWFNRARPQFASLGV
jgi:hypothetical protein